MIERSKIKKVFAFLPIFFGLLLFVPARAQTLVATKGYVDGAFDSAIDSVELANAIATAVQDLQSKTEKTTTIGPSSTDEEYPSAKAVYDMVQQDPRFESLPDTTPTGAPPSGRFYIWIED